MNPEGLIASCVIVLVGLQLCRPSTKSSFDLRLIERDWTHHPILRSIHGILNLAGVLFVLGSVGYLMIEYEWWYIFVYIVALIGTWLFAFVLRKILFPISKKLHYMYSNVLVERIVGNIIITFGFFSILFALN